jgi:hypothetical protein
VKIFQIARVKKKRVSRAGNLSLTKNPQLAAPRATIGRLFEDSLPVNQELSCH